jgi:hypothetical protein
VTATHSATSSQITVNPASNALTQGELAGIGVGAFATFFLLIGCGFCFGLAYKNQQPHDKKLPPATTITPDLKTVVATAERRLSRRQSQALQIRSPETTA